MMSSVFSADEDKARIAVWTGCHAHSGAIVRARLVRVGRPEPYLWHRRGRK